LSSRNFWRLAVAFSLLVALASPLRAQTPQSGLVQEIRVEGNQRIEPETIRSYLTLDIGKPFDAQAMDASLKALFSTGLFADVLVRREGNVLVVRVVENPIINRIAFEGNKRIEDPALQSEVQLRPRTVFTRTRVQADTQRLLDLYRRSGRFAATVEPKVIELDQNRVDLVFEINEGELTEIRQIAFIGNRRFGDSRLKEEITTRETRWYRFFSSSDRYDPDRLNFDRDQLRRFYLSQGYADFRVISAVAELAPERDGFFLTFTLEEGERYKFGEVDLTSKVKDVDSKELKSELTMAKDDWYNANEVEKSIQRLTNRLGNLGFAFVEVRPAVQRKRDDKTIDIVFEIEEGPRVYVERIDIIDNVRTIDSVIRREFQIVEGDAFSTQKLRRSRQRVQDLGYFKKVDVTNAQGTASDRTVVTVKVEEQSTGELSLGAGFSTISGVLADVGIRERNLLGRGYDTRAGVRLGVLTQEIDFSFTDPYFLDKPIAAGFDAFHIEQDRQRESRYDLRATGTGLRAGYNLSEPLRHTVRYTLRQDDIRNVQTNASRFILDQQGSRVASIIGHTLFYDKRNSRLQPSEGYFLQFGNDFAGVGGSVEYFRTRVGAGYYFPITEEVVFALTSEAGTITGLFGDKVRINDRFFVGGDNLRGFRNAGVGPRDADTGDSLGANHFVTGSAEVRFPIGLPQEYGVTGHVFSDAGTATGTDSSTVRINDTASIRVSVGAGVAWVSPFGPIKVDFGVPLLKESYDREEFFKFSFGTRF
jgi:outer membrane protein insertion porin family